MDPVVLAVFAVVYLGMVLGELPGLALDRTGIALLGAIAFVATGHVTVPGAWAAIDVPTIALLLGLMVVSAQLRLGGFYALVAERIANARFSPPTLLALLVGTAGALSALLVNDIVCLAFAPVLVAGCSRRGLDPLPFLLALACASNVGSAATLIGNPQNILIGQALSLSFARYSLTALVPVLLGLAAVWGVVAFLHRGRWRKETPLLPPPERRTEPPFDRRQTGKGLAALALTVGLFLLSPWPREAVALGAAGLVLASRRFHSARMLGLVDWQLLVLFSGLFIVNHVLGASGAPTWARGLALSAGVDLAAPAPLFAAAVVLSNLVSNVPAVMLLLPFASHPQAGPLLALASTLAGNLLLVGSIANLIVAGQARAHGVAFTWRDHARVGIPVTALTLAFAGGWLFLIR